MSTAVDQTGRRLTGDPHADPIAASRAYDEALQTVRAQLLPLIYTLRLRPDENLRSRMLLLAACGYSLRALASLAYDAPLDCPAQNILRLQEHVQQQIHIALDRLQNGEAAMPPQDETEAYGEGTTIAHLARIDRSVHRLAMGLPIVAW